ncbi:MAG: HAD-IA family hydrolase [Ignavibacteria bacterium]|nr:HAD-IA family hydrolase [Ignavibacteria bacterium]
MNGYIFITLKRIPEMSIPIRCVIFDMDGTLTRTNELIFASFNHVAAKYLGATMTPPEIIGLFGPPEEDGLAKLVGEKHAVAAMDDLCEFYRENHRAMARLHAGIEEVLSFLREKQIRQAVFTGKGRRTTAITLDAFKLRSYFDLIVSGTDVTHHKPHPEGICRVLSTLGVQAEEALMVGDSLADIRASRGAGVRIASVVWDSYDRERVMRENSEILFHTVEDMLVWLRAYTN